MGRLVLEKALLLIVEQWWLAEVTHIQMLRAEIKGALNCQLMHPHTHTTGVLLPLYPSPAVGQQSGRVMEGWL